ncbi:MAG: DUF1343 domain-containing protein [Bacteroidetes bacterium]|nr:MAG: DUF1343 domain-containing protein [Bacteroidota bacterium]RLD92361.1 MAG: DUF1343 domain-containing protein [Bacteroidota bacterium]
MYASFSYFYAVFRFLISTIFILNGLMAACSPDTPPVRCGADQLDQYLALIEGKQIALVANHTSLVGGRHLVDTLLARGIERDQIVKVFAPEHGFRGDRAAGVQIEDGTDPLTGIPVASLYGSHKKPEPGELAGIELMLFDLQDVGARFYTYISTLHYVMEACAENNIPLILLDRPNPNGAYVDGPVLDTAFSSFVGMHPIPVVYGLTIGELAGMINGEGWLSKGIRCRVTVIPCADYTRGQPYSMPVSPSPNLANDHAVLMYPSTCFFEGTVLSEGRGTDMPFEVYGHPDLPGAFSFTPEIIAGVARNPKFKGSICYGEDLRSFTPEEGWTRIHLQWLLEAYKAFPQKEEFFTSYFSTLAGTDKLRMQVEAGWDEERIRASWQEELEQYKEKRRKYLIYDEND